MHRHTAHPHVHVLVGAAADRADGSREEVRFTPADYAVLRESGDRWAKRARDDHALLRDVARYLTIAVAPVVAGVTRCGSHADTRPGPDDEEDERRRRDARRR